MGKDKEQQAVKRYVAAGQTVRGLLLLRLSDVRAR